MRRAELAPQQSQDSTAVQANQTQDDPRVAGEPLRIRRVRVLPRDRIGDTPPLMPKATGLAPRQQLD